MTKPSNTSDFMSEPDTSTADQIILDNMSVSTATPELPSPLLTASGKLTNAALVLVKITSKCGVEGHSYLFSPSCIGVFVAFVKSAAFSNISAKIGSSIHVRPRSSSSLQRSKA